MPPDTEDFGTMVRRRGHGVATWSNVRNFLSHTLSSVKSLDLSLDLGRLPVNLCLDAEQHSVQLGCAWQLLVLAARHPVRLRQAGCR